MNDVSVDGEIMLNGVHAGLIVIANEAVIFVSAFNVVTHVPVPEQPPPLQPSKVELFEATAVNVITAP